MNLGIASVASITVIATLAGAVWKTAKKLPDEWIPVVCGFVGLVLGIIGFYLGIKDFPADDVITAAAVGIVSGFAATGINQIFKQFKKNNPDLPVDDSVETPEEPEDSGETN